MNGSKTILETEDISVVANGNIDFGKLKNRKLLISGGTGFLGNFLIDVFRYRNLMFGDNINAVILSRRGGNDSDNFKFVAQDVTQSFDLPGEFDYVLHLASNTHPKQYKEDPVGTITANVYGCDNLLKIARKNGAKFLLASSVEIYGNGADKPIAESYCGYIDCNTVRAGYNEAKRVCESLSRSYKEQYGVYTVTARFARVFGADGKADSKAIAQFMNKALCGEDIVLNSYGKQRFSYCYVADAVSGMLKILTDGAAGEAYNVSGDDDGDTLGGYAKFIAGLGGVNTVFDIKSDPGASKADYAVVNCDKLKDLGWMPIYEIKPAMERTFNILKLWKNK